MSVSINFQEFLVSSILFPVLLLIIKSLIGDEIVYWLHFFHCYFHRPFDLDGNPATPDWLMLYNPGNGEWEISSIQYRFCFNKDYAGVLCSYYNTDYVITHTYRIPFRIWRDLPKASINKSILPPEMVSKLLI